VNITDSHVTTAEENQLSSAGTSRMTGNLYKSKKKILYLSAVENKQMTI